MSTYFWLRLTNSVPLQLVHVFHGYLSDLHGDHLQGVIGALPGVPCDPSVGADSRPPLIEPIGVGLVALPRSVPKATGIGVGAAPGGVPVKGREVPPIREGQGVT